MTAASSPAGPASENTIKVIMAGLLLGLLLAALDQTIIASSLRTIADDLDGLSAQAWATSAYLIAAVIATPLYGKLSDTYGRRPLYLVAISTFLLGSVLCAVAQSMYELAAFRAVQGLGAGGLMALALAILADLLPPRERVRYQAYLGSAYAVASVAGPALGGTLAGADEILGIAGWRWAFLINVPLGLVALAIIAFRVSLPRRGIAQRLDYAGTCALVLAVVPLLVVAEQGKAWGWGSAGSIAMLCVGAIGLVLFVLAERKMGDEALLPPRLFSNRTFSVINGVNFAVGIGTFGGIVLLPLYLQIVKGLGPTAAGLMLIPQTAAIIISSRVVGPIVVRTRRYKPFLVAGVALAALGALGFSQLTFGSPLWLTATIAVVMGTGFGLFFQVVIAGLQDGVPPKDIGVASGLFTFFRQIGGAVGVALLLSITFNVADARVNDDLRAARSTPSFQRALSDPTVTADPASQPVLRALRGSSAGLNLNDTSYLRDLDPRLAAPIRKGMASAIGTAFLFAGLALALAALLPLALREGADARAPTPTDSETPADAAGTNHEREMTRT